MNIFDMVKQFSGELYNYVKEGAPNVSLKQYEERLKTCNSCEHISERIT